MKRKKNTFSDPLDALGQDDNFTPQPASRRRGRRPFQSPTDDLSATEVSQASSGKGMAGRYKRKTITLPPEQIAYIAELAANEEMGVLAFYRWLIDTALMVYEDGYRPDIQVRQVRGEAKKGHWSSEI